jgi:hypothetical protein
MTVQQPLLLGVVKVGAKGAATCAFWEALQSKAAEKCARSAAISKCWSLSWISHQLCKGDMSKAAQAVLFEVGVLLLGNTAQFTHHDVCG